CVAAWVRQSRSMHRKSWAGPQLNTGFSKQDIGGLGRQRQGAVREAHARAVTDVKAIRNWPAARAAGVPVGMSVSSLQTLKDCCQLTANPRYCRIGSTLSENPWVTMVC